MEQAAEEQAQFWLSPVPVLLPLAVEEQGRTAVMQQLPPVELAEFQRAEMGREHLEEEVQQLRAEAQLAETA